MAYSKVIICGLRDVGKTTALWGLQKRLNWPMFSVSQFLRDYHKRYGLQRISNTQLAQHEDEMREEIDSRTANLLRSEHQVIVETRAFHYVKDQWPETLKVLLTARDDIRIKRNAFRESISEEKSAARLLKKEGKWVEDMARQYGFSDFMDPQYFDLVIDTSDMRKEEVVQMIAAKLALL